MVEEMEKKSASLSKKDRADMDEKRREAETAINNLETAGNL